MVQRMVRMKSQAWIFVAVAAALLVGLFYLFRPAQEVPAPQPASAVAPAAPPLPVVMAQPYVYDLVIKKRRLVSGPQTLQVRQGAEVTLRVTVDEAEELHLHGYDRKLDLVAGQPGVLRFTADKSGRFEYELEHSRTELGALEVQPQ